ncbi:hypothetical protein NC652_017794 [Populus alba x Populus x berolinensis]|nr:hypothetical protein NC652_017794 [Populus alba x Populus x berolinensis]
MVDVCGKSENLGYATLLSKQVKESNEYLYNAMIRAYAHNVEVFDGMIERDSISWNGIFSGNARLGHMRKARASFDSIPYKTSLCNAHIEMYAKCGCIGQACQSFDQMYRRGVISWSAIIRKIHKGCLYFLTWLGKEFGKLSPINFIFF